MNTSDNPYAYSLSGEPVPDGPPAYILFGEKSERSNGSGVEVVRLALRGWDSEIVDAEDEFERAQTRYVLQEGAALLLVALIRVLFT